MNRLTASRLSSLRKCPRQHYYRYELGLSRVRDAAALRFGAAYHVGLELFNSGKSADEAIATATAGYATCPGWADPTEWAVECEKIRQLLAGYFWRYENDDIEILSAEQVFETSLLNPVTSSASRTFSLAGKIDALVRLAPSRLAVLEYKTTGEDIGPNSEYWLRLRCDPQISQYILGARALGHDTATVIYDVTRKPTIQPKQIPLLDDKGNKIVLDADGRRVINPNGKPRQSADKEKGYTLQTRPETPQEYGQRLLEDIGDRPDFYYARREVPRLEDELQEFQLELWQQARQLREAQRHGRWFRNVGKMTCDYCQFSDLCLQGIHVEPDKPPAGYEILADVHAELATT